jgi:imidazolonepropionase-like amidohydrolase
MVRRRTVLAAGSTLLPAASLGAGEGAARAEVPVSRPALLVLSAARMFDGRRMLSDAAVLLRGSTVAAVGSRGSVQHRVAVLVDLGDATILPGFIDLHVHVTARNIPFERVVAGGVTTARDLAGRLPSTAGRGQLRYLAAGPIITAPGGYPIPVFGPQGARVVTGEGQARQAVRDLVAGGAAVIKVGLDPGGEPGAPWSLRPPSTPFPWPLLSVGEVRAIVTEAHRLGRIVTAHLAEERGVAIALAAGVDEWAHIPCLPVPRAQLTEAVRRGVAVVGTLDSDSHCAGSLDNARAFVALGGKLLYGTDMGHIDIPEGIDAQELELMMRAGMSLENALASATSRAAQHLGLSPLGTLTPGAPADVIAVPGDLTKDLKNIEYPLVVIAGGEVVVQGGRRVRP